MDHLSLCLYTSLETLSLQNLIEPFNLLSLTDFRVVFRKWFLANSPFQLTDFRVVFRKWFLVNSLFQLTAGLLKLTTSGQIRTQNHQTVRQVILLPSAVMLSHKLSIFLISREESRAESSVLR